MSRTAKQVATKIVALLAGDYTGKWEIRSVRDVVYGQEVIVADAASVHDEEEYIVTVQKRTVAVAITAEVDEIATKRREKVQDAGDEPPL